MPPRSPLLAAVTVAAVVLLAGLSLFGPGAPRMVPPATGTSAPVPSPSLAARPAIAGLSWTDLTAAENGTAPPAGGLGSMAYDVADHEYVYFGGCAAECPSNSTWVFQGGTWTNVTNPAHAPPARYGASMDYDPNAGGVLLFGGDGVGAVGLNDTWLFQGGAWTNVGDLSAAPPARTAADMAFDPASGINGSLLFGGCVPTFGIFCLNDTWVWHPGSGWTEFANLTTPDVRGDAMMAYDATDGYMLLYGGFGICGTSLCFFNDTWEFYAGTWWSVVPPTGHPPARDTASMTYDAGLGGVVMFGGYNETTGTTLAETWLFHGGTWTNLTQGGGPSAREGAALSSDSGGLPPVLFGGFLSGFADPVAETWVGEPTPTASLAGVPSTAEAGGTITAQLTVGGGTGPLSVTVDFGDGAGAAASGAGPAFSFAHTYSDPQNCTVRATVTDWFGATATAANAVRVVAGPTVVASSGTPTGDVGIAVHFAGSPGAGFVLSNYSWAFSDASGAAPTGAAVSHAFAAAGTFAVTVTATDAAGAQAQGSLSFPVEPDPTATIGSIASGATAGADLPFTATVAGGSPPFAFAWRFGDGGASGGASPVHAYGAAGSYTAQLWVNDSAGGSSHTTAAVTVGAATTGPGGSNVTGSSSSAAIPTWYWAALAVIGIGTVVGAVLLLRRPR